MAFLKRRNAGFRGVAQVLQVPQGLEELLGVKPIKTFVVKQRGSAPTNVAAIELPLRPEVFVLVKT